MSREVTPGPLITGPPCARESQDPQRELSKQLLLRKLNLTDWREQKKSMIIKCFYKHARPPGAFTRNMVRKPARVTQRPGRRATDQPSRCSGLRQAAPASGRRGLRWALGAATQSVSRASWPFSLQDATWPCGGWGRTLRLRVGVGTTIPAGPVGPPPQGWGHPHTAQSPGPGVTRLTVARCGNLLAPTSSRASSLLPTAAPQAPSAMPGGEASGSQCAPGCQHRGSRLKCRPRAPSQLGS